MPANNNRPWIALMQFSYSSLRQTFCSTLQNINTVREYSQCIIGMEAGHWVKVVEVDQWEG